MPLDLSVERWKCTCDKCANANACTADVEREHCSFTKTLEDGKKKTFVATLVHYEFDAVALSKTTSTSGVDATLEATQAEIKRLFDAHQTERASDISTTYYQEEATPNSVASYALTNVTFDV